MLNHGQKKWPVVGGECSDMFYGVLLMVSVFFPHICHQYTGLTREKRKTPKQSILADCA